MNYYGCADWEILNLVDPCIIFIFKYITLQKHFMVIKFLIVFILIIKQYYSYFEGHRTSSFFQYTKLTKLYRCAQLVLLACGIMYILLWASGFPSY